MVLLECSGYSGALLKMMLILVAPTILSLPGLADYTDIAQIKIDMVDLVRSEVRGYF